MLLVQGAGDLAALRALQQRQPPRGAAAQGVAGGPGAGGGGPGAEPRVRRGRAHRPAALPAPPAGSQSARSACCPLHPLSLSITSTPARGLRQTCTGMAGGGELLRRPVITVLPPAVIQEVAAVVAGPTNFGPTAEAATPWVQLAMYTAMRAGPLSVVLACGQRLWRLPPQLLGSSHCLIWPWDSQAVRAHVSAPCHVPAAVSHAAELRQCIAARGPPAQAQRPELRCSGLSGAHFYTSTCTLPALLAPAHRCSWCLPVSIEYDSLLIN